MSEMAIDWWIVALVWAVLEAAAWGCSYWINCVDVCGDGITVSHAALNLTIGPVLVAILLMILPFMAVWAVLEWLNDKRKEKWPPNPVPLHNRVIVKPRRAALKAP